MATSSNFGTTNKYVVYNIEAIENYTSIENNLSNVTVIVRCWRTNSGYTTYGTGTCHCAINGTWYSQSIASSQKFTYNSYTEIFRITVDVPHNDDGSKTVWISSYISHQQFSSNDQGFNVNLTTIARASQPSLITWPNSTYNIGNLGDTITIHMNRASDSFVHYVYYVWGDKQAAIGYDVGVNCSWTIPNNFAENVPNGTVGYGTIHVDTWNNGVYVGSKSVTFSANIPDTDLFRPHISAINISENSNRIPSDWGKYVQNISKIKYDISANGVYNSTINSYRVTINGATYTQNSNITDVLHYSGTNTISVTVTDSRGRQRTSSKNFEVIEYAGPAIKVFDVFRCLENGVYNDEGEYVKVEISATIPRIGDKNSYSYFLKYKLDTEQEYEIASITIDETTDDKNYILNHSTILAADPDSSYDYMFMLADALIAVNSERGVGSIFQLLNYNASGKGLGIGKVSEKDALEIGMEIYDRFGQLMNNGLAEYQNVTPGVNIDADTTIAHLILTDVNTPNNSFYYVMTFFYGSKTTTTNRTQIAVPYIYDVEHKKTTVYIRQNVGGTWNEWAQVGGPKILYDNWDGSDGTITLSESALNFSYIEVFYKSRYGFHTSSRLENPNGRSVQLFWANVFGTSSNTVVAESRVMYISGTSMTIDSEYGEWWSYANDINEFNYIKVTRVVGYR